MKRQVASTGEIIDDGKTAKKPRESILAVKVYSPFKVYFQGEANSVSAVNNTGPFDILPQHHNFLTLLNACDLVIRTSETKQKIRIARGVMHVRANHVTVFLDV